jgi:hypothetical protein
MTYSEQVEMERLQDREERAIIHGRMLSPGYRDRLEQLETKYYVSIRKASEVGRA